MKRTPVVLTLTVAATVGVAIWALTHYGHEGQAHDAAPAAEPAPAAIDGAGNPGEAADR